MQNDPYSKSNAIKGALHYLIGKSGSAFGGVAVVILLVRYVDVDNYAAYTALSGLVTLSGMLANIGIERVISRYIPEARIKRSVKELTSLILFTVLMRLLLVLLVVFILYFFWSELDSFLAVVEYKKFTLALGLLIIAESIFQHFASIFQALLLQKILAGMMTIQWSGRLLIVCYFIFTKSNISWEDVLWVFAIPESIGVLGFVISLIWYLNVLKKDQEKQIAVTNDQPWLNYRELMKVSLHNYGFLLLSAPAQGYSIKMLSAAYLPADVVAAYGFFINIAEKIRQYLPLYFFYGLIEPMMISTYLKDNDFVALSQRCQLLYKFNLMIMVPIILALTESGEALVKLLAADKFIGLSWILLTIMVQFTIGSHIVLLQLILNTLQKSKVLIMASAFALFIFIIIMFLVVVYYPLAMFFIPVISSVIMNSFILISLSIFNYAYKPSTKMLFCVLLSAIISFLPIHYVSMFFPEQHSGLLYVFSVFVSLTSIFLLMVWKFNVFENNEIIYLKSIFSKRKAI